MRPEIALSWRRSQISGLEPAVPNLRFEPDAVGRRTRLRTAATPVLAGLADQLAGAPFCVVLADRDSHIVDVPTGPRQLRNRLERLGVVTGGVFLEETTGTNSIAMAHELRCGVAVHGEEHYLEPFKAFSCYGQPIIHPVTRRLAGVLDITCLSEHTSLLLRPLIAQAARDIEMSLLETSRRAEQRLLTEFQVATSGHDRPVLVLGGAVVLATRSATELLAPLDHIRLGELAADMSGRPGRGAGLGERVARVELASGQIVEVRLRAVEPGFDGVLVELTPQNVIADSPRAQGNRGPGAHVEVVAGQPVYVGGDPGTGRTTTAKAMAGASGIVMMDGAEPGLSADAVWSAAARRFAESGATVLVVENIHLLSEPDAIRLHRFMAGARPRAVLTGAPASALTGYPAMLAAGCPVHVELPALVQRAQDIPHFVQTMLDDMGVGGVRFTAAALSALAGQLWPGNLRELQAVVCAAVGRRTTGDVTPQDLPQRYRVSQRYRTMSTLERAEHDVIVAVLRACDGNKQRAAEQLGISRAALYNRLRALHITARGLSKI